MFWLFNVVVASFAVIPGAASATSIAAGVIYGTPVGVALVSTSCAVGAGVSFLIARYAARPLVERVFIKEGSRFAVLDQAVMRDGAQIVLLDRILERARAEADRMVAQHEVYLAAVAEAELPAWPITHAEVVGEDEYDFGE